MATMHAKDVMTKGVTYLPPTATLTEAAKKMLSIDCGFLPIGENDRLLGAVTDRDITIRAVAKGKDPNKTTIKEVMSQKIQFCFEEDDLKDVAQKMEEEEIRRLVVLNKNKRMTGVISLGDLATEGKNTQLSGEVLEEVSKH